MHSSPQPTQLMLDKLAEQKIYVATQEDGHYITITGKSFRILDGEEFPDVNAVSIGRGPFGREISLYDPHCPVLADLVAELEKNIPSTASTEVILTEMLKLVRKTFPTTETATFALPWTGKVDRIAKTEGIIEFNEFIKNKAGWCRHHALLVSHLVKALIKNKRLPDGKTHYVRSTAQGTPHAWAIYRPYQQKPLDIYWLDAIQNDRIFLLIRDETALLNQYGQEAYSKCVYRYYGSWVAGPAYCFTYDASNGSCIYKDEKEIKGALYSRPSGVQKILGKKGSYGSAEEVINGSQSYVIKKFTYKGREFDAADSELSIEKTMRVDFIATAREAPIHFQRHKIGAASCIFEPLTFRVESGKRIVVTAPELFVFQIKFPGDSYDVFPITSAKVGLQLARAVLKATLACHQDGVLHLDIHENNVHVETKGNTLIAHLFDHSCSTYSPGEQLEINRLRLRLVDATTAVRFKPPEYSGVTSILADAKQDVWCVDRLLGLKLEEKLFSPTVYQHIRTAKAGMGEANPDNRITITQGLDHYNAAYLQLLSDEIKLAPSQDKPNLLFQAITTLEKIELRKKLLGTNPFDALITFINHPHFIKLDMSFQNEYIDHLLSERKKIIEEAPFEDHVIDQWCYLMDLRHQVKTPERMAEEKLSPAELVYKGLIQIEKVGKEATENFVTHCFNEKVFLDILQTLSPIHINKLISHLIAQENSLFLKNSLNHAHLFFIILEKLDSAVAIQAKIQFILFIKRDWLPKSSKARLSHFIHQLGPLSDSSKESILYALPLSWLKDMLALPDLITFRTHPDLRKLFILYIKKINQQLPPEPPVNALEQWCTYALYTAQLCDIKISDDTFKKIHADVLYAPDEKKAISVSRHVAEEVCQSILRDSSFLTLFYDMLCHLPQDTIKNIFLHLKAEKTVWDLFNHDIRIHHVLLSLISKHDKCLLDDILIYQSNKINNTPNLINKDFFDALDVLKLPAYQEQYIMGCRSLHTLIRKTGFFSLLANTSTHIKWMILHRVYQLLLNEFTNKDLYSDKVDEFCYVLRYLIELERNKNNADTCTCATMALHRVLHPTETVTHPGLMRLRGVLYSGNDLFNALQQHIHSHQVRPFLTYLDKSSPVYLFSDFDDMLYNCLKSSHISTQHAFLYFKIHYPSRIHPILKRQILDSTPQKQLTQFSQILNDYNGLSFEFTRKQWHIMLSQSELRENKSDDFPVAFNKVIACLSVFLRRELLSFFAFEKAIDQWFYYAWAELVCNEGTCESETIRHITLQASRDLTEEKQVTIPHEGVKRYREWMEKDTLSLTYFIKQLQNIRPSYRKLALDYLCGTHSTYLWHLFKNEPPLFKDLVNLLSLDERMYFISHQLAYLKDHPDRIFDLLSNKEEIYRLEILKNMPQHPEFIRQLKSTHSSTLQYDTLVYIYNKLCREFAASPVRENMDGFCYTVQFCHQLNIRRDTDTLARAIAGLENRLLNPTKPWGTPDRYHGAHIGLVRLKENMLDVKDAYTPKRLIYILSQLKEKDIKLFLVYLGSHFDEITKYFRFVEAMHLASYSTRKALYELILFSPDKKWQGLFSTIELREYVMSSRIKNVNLNMELTSLSDIVTFLLNQARRQFEDCFPATHAIDKWCYASTFTNPPERIDYLALTDEKSGWKPSSGLRLLENKIKSSKKSEPFVQYLGKLTDSTKIQYVLEYIRPLTVTLLSQPDFFSSSIYFVPLKNRIVVNYLEINPAAYYPFIILELLSTLINETSRNRLLESIPLIILNRMASQSNFISLFDRLPAWEKSEIFTHLHERQWAYLRTQLSNPIEIDKLCYLESISVDLHEIKDEKSISAHLTKSMVQYSALVDRKPWNDRVGANAFINNPFCLKHRLIDFLNKINSVDRLTLIRHASILAALSFSLDWKLIQTIYNKLNQCDQKSFLIDWLTLAKTKLSSSRTVSPEQSDEWYYYTQQLADIHADKPSCMESAYTSIALAAEEWKRGTGLELYIKDMSFTKLVAELKTPFPPDKIFLLHTLGTETLQNLIHGAYEEKQVTGSLLPEQMRFFQLLAAVPETQQTDFLKLLGASFISSITVNLPFVYYKILVEAMTAAFMESIDDNPKIHAIHERFARELFNRNNRQFEKTMKEVANWESEPLYAVIWTQLAEIYYGTRESASDSFFFKRLPALSACRKIKSILLNPGALHLEENEQKEATRGDLGVLVAPLKKRGRITF